MNALKRAVPEARLTFLIYKEFAPLLEGFPHIDSVIELDRSHFRGLRPQILLPAAVRLLRALRRKRFDLTIDFQGFGETGLISWWTGAAHRWGGVYRSARGWPYTRGVRRDTNLHAIDYQLEILNRGGGIPAAPLLNQFTVPLTAREEARRILQDWNMKLDRPTLFIQPFSNGPHKNWPLKGYLEVAKHWKARGSQVMFGGGPGDRPQLEIAREQGFSVAAGSPLLVSAALADLASVVLGGDTGLLHLAVAMGKRVVMIINSTSSGSCFPYAHPDWAVAPGPGGNLSSVQPGSVIAACARALAEVQKGRGENEPGSHPAALKAL